jgi:acyl carrier protein
MLLRSQISKATTTSVRLLHTTRPAPGFMDWFSLKKSEEKKKQQKAVEKPKDINEVIADAEQGKIDLKKVEKIEFIGVKHRKGAAKGKFNLQTEEQIQSKIDELGFKVWLNDKKVSNLEELKSIVVQSYNEVTNGSSAVENFKFDEVKLDDLQFRFDLTLKIQEKTGFIIPDKTLSDISNLQELISFFDYTILGNKTYLQKILEKNTLDVADLKFESPNISIQTPVNSKQRKATYDELLSVAKKSQEYKAKKLIDESRA